MAFRNIIIENPAHISVRNGQLVIKTNSEHSVSIEDISALLIENKASSITVAALSCLGQGGCTVFVCDDKHMPCAVMEPFSQHSRELSVLNLQIGAREPLKKRLWQSMIVAKIENQARCLNFCGNAEAAEALKSMTSRVRSGDSDNVEAAAAKKYFSELFFNGFTRGDDSVYNAALNYGYAVLRGCVARSLASYGFQPALGLHHKSALNRFNLADDMIEPFRPVIDQLVFNLVDGGCPTLTPQIKRQLFNCLNLDILSGGRHHSVSYAIERAVYSLSHSLSAGKAELLLPELLEIRQHRYE